MTTRTIDATTQAEVRARIDDRARAARAKDVDGIMACYAPDTLSFDCHSHLQFQGAEASEAPEAACPTRLYPMIEIHDLDGSSARRRGVLPPPRPLRRDRVERRRAYRVAARDRLSPQARGRVADRARPLLRPVRPGGGKAMLDLAPEHARRASAA